MKFSEDLVRELYKAWKEGKLVKINGMNTYGEQFTTEGRITTTDKDTIGINDGVVFLEFGKSKDSETRKQTRYFAPYKTDIETELDFGIFTIEIEGKIVYENPNKEKMIEEGKIKDQQEQERLQTEGRWTLPQCPVVEQLKNMVGKPIILDNNHGVLHNVRGTNMLGNPMVEIRSGTLVGAISVKTNSVLETEDNNGKISTLAQNNPQEYSQAVSRLESASEFSE